MSVSGAQLRSEMEPGCDPALLRERMPEVLAFIREWVGKADGDDLVLLVQALDAHIDVSLEEADIRVEVPMIEGAGGNNLAPIEQTSASLVRDDMIVRVPLVVNVALAGRARGERSTQSP